jgi:hypothetical protein
MKRNETFPDPLNKVPLTSDEPEPHHVTTRYGAAREQVSVSHMWGRGRWVIDNGLRSSIVCHRRLVRIWEKAEFVFWFKLSSLLQYICFPGAETVAGLGPSKGLMEGEAEGSSS